MAHKNDNTQHTALFFRILDQKVRTRLTYNSKSCSLWYLQLKITERSDQIELFRHS